MNLMSRKKIWKISLCTLLLCGATCVQAGFWRWTKPFVGPNQKISTLIITGNYADSRMLAELIQDKNRQPILLVPAAGGDSIFFIPPKKGSKAMKIPFAELTNFINFVGAKQILVLGNSSYVPDKYFEKISNIQTVCRIKSKNWNNVAYTLGKFLNLSNLATDYKTLQKKMKNEVNYVRANGDTKIDDELTIPDEISTETPAKTEEPIIIDASQK